MPFSTRGLPRKAVQGMRQPTLHDPKLRQRGLRKLRGKSSPLRQEVLRRGDLWPRRRFSHFGLLCRTVIDQQISSGAAASIWKRWRTDLGGPPRPADVAGRSLDSMRACGLSASKAATLLRLADACASGELSLRGLTHLTDDEVIDRLTAWKGLGPWSAQMYLLFALGRPDVFSTGDLGLRRSATRLFELPRDAEAEKILERVEVFRPYRSLASLYLWQLGDDPD